MTSGRARDGLDCNLELPDCMHDAQFTGATASYVLIHGLAWSKETSNYLYLLCIDICVYISNLNPTMLVMLHRNRLISTV